MSRSRRSAPVGPPTQVTVRAVGPLDPWRLPAVVVGVALTSGAALLEATRTGDHLDRVLVRAFVVGLAIWVLLGMISKMLAQASVERALERTRQELVDPVPGADPGPSSTSGTPTSTSGTS